MPIDSTNSDESFNQSIEAIDARLKGVGNQDFEKQINTLESIIDDLNTLLDD